MHNKGFVAFVRKLGNKVADLAHKNEEVNGFLEAVPEWKEFYENSLVPANTRENTPFCDGDPRNKQDSPEDDYLDILYKFKDSGRSGFHNRRRNDNNDDEEQDDEDEDEDHTNNDLYEDEDKQQDDEDDLHRMIPSDENEDAA